MSSPQPPEGFGPWSPLTADAAVGLPRGPGVLQIKVAGALLAYPRGKSAMVLYAGVTDVGGWLARSLEPIHARAAARGLTADLRFRFRPDPRPDAAAAELLGRFVARFGALPVLTTGAVPAGS